MARTKKKNNWQKNFWAVVVWGFTGIFILSFFANLTQTPAFQNLFLGRSSAEESTGGGGDLPSPPEEMEITFEGDADDGSDDFTVTLDDQGRVSNVSDDHPLTDEQRAALQKEIDKIKEKAGREALNRAFTEGDPLDVPVINNGAIDVINIERGGGGQFGFTVDLAGDASEPVKYINLIYRFAIMIATLLAIAMLTWGGYRYLFAGVDTNAIKEGREIIGSALSGLILLLMSYIILTTLNPNIFEGGDKVLIFEGGELTSQTTTSEDRAHQEKLAKYAALENQLNLASIPSNIDVKNNRSANQGTVEKLRNLWNDTASLRGESPWWVTEAYPPTSQHVSEAHYDGRFIDIAFKDGRFKNRDNYNNLASFESRQLDELIGAAKNAGFKVMDEYRNPSSLATGPHLHLELEGVPSPA